MIFPISLSDYQLAQKSLKSSEYFGEIIARYEQPLSRFLFRLGAKEQEEREDILQDTFLKIYTHLEEVDKDLSFSSWVYRIARNTFYDVFRKKESRGKKIEFTEEESEIFWNTIPDFSQNIPENFEKKKRGEYIRKKISALPDIKKEIFILFFLEEKSYEEISDILKINQNSIATHLSRGKKMLKEMIERDIKSPL